jgi:hypothetical protein
MGALYSKTGTSCGHNLKKFKVQESEFRSQESEVREFGSCWVGYLNDVSNSYLEKKEPQKARASDF